MTRASPGRSITSALINLLVALYISSVGKSFTIVSIEDRQMP
jgi:hypothetical protein